MDEPKATSMLGFVYLQAKANHFMRVGPDIYRKFDFFHLPDASCGFRRSRTVIPI